MWLIYSLVALGFIFISIALWFKMQWDTRPHYEELMELDFLTCAKMRSAGWNESDIKDYMHINNGHYDKKYVEGD